MLLLTFSSKLDWSSYIISIAKSASKKIGALIRSMKFLSPEVVLYLYRCIICPCMEYCCHTWTGALSCFLELLDKLKKQICKTIDPSFAAFLELSVHWQSLASLSLFYRYLFCQCSSELVFQLLFLEGGFLVILIDGIVFLSPFLEVTKMSYVNNFFPRTARLWNSLSIEYSPLTHNLNCFKSRINRLLLTLDSL